MYQGGAAAYESGAYDLALRSFQQAYNLTAKPALFYNMALCQEKLGKIGEAIASFRRYIAESPTVGDRAEIENRIAALLQKQNDVSASETGIVPALVQHSPSMAMTIRRRTMWAMLGVTGALGVGVAGLGGATLTQHNNLAATCSAPGAPGCDAGEVSAVRSQAIATDVLIGLTAMAAVTTVALLIIELRPTRSAASSRRVARR